MTTTERPMVEVTAVDGTTFWKCERPDTSDWIEVRHSEDPRGGRGGYVYTAYDISQDPPPIIGTLQYTKDSPRPGYFTFRSFGTRPDYQRRGVASALLEQLHIDLPHYTGDPGVATEMGLSWARHILAREPEVRKWLIPGYVEKSTGY